MGAGHVTFFYNKLGYLKERYIAVYRECLRRGYNVTNFAACFDSSVIREFQDRFGVCITCNYVPTKADRQIIIQRIRENGFNLLKRK